MNSRKNERQAEMPVRKALIEYCLRLPGAYEDYPFDEDSSSFGAWTVMRHRENQKSFALIFEHGGSLNINLKCDPAEADFLRGIYRSVIPAYHMNKEHWIGVLLDGGVPVKELQSWIDASYRCTLPRRKRKY